MVKQKAGSEKGASLTFALLLFLVCAVVSSVVIVAGTAASGRMSQLREMDQRYYAVTSAARVLVDEIDGQSVTVVKKTIQSTSALEGPEYGLYDKKYVDIADSLFQLEAALSYDADKTLLTQTADRLAGRAAPEVASASPIKITYKLTAEEAGSDYSGLAVWIEESCNADGMMTLRIQDKEFSSTDPSYKLQLTFTADVKSQIGELRHVTNSKAVKIEGKEFTWHLDRIETLNTRSSGSGMSGAAPFIGG